MSKHPAPDRERHDDFCVIERWEIVHGSKGKPVQHHRTYELVIPSGDILRTRISKPVDRTTYSASMWSAILRDQLKVTNDEFWACVQNKVLPDRGGAVAASNPKALPLHLLNELIERVGMTPEDAIALTLEEALQRMNDYWTEGADTDARRVRQNQAIDELAQIPVDPDAARAE
ncbi:MAG: cytotoxic translational repressor of toxin-antitoxin stability system [Schumannella sp.]|nr:cytotoxic translational repressor of toxin-antitoxin stability system [Schumannella sp.]